MRKKLVIAVIFAIFVFVFASGGTAEASKATNIPWETALEKLSKSLTGPVAFSLGLLMIVCGFCAVAFVGSELGGWVRWVAMAAILAGMLGSASGVLSLFGLESAIIM